MGRATVPGKRRNTGSEAILPNRLTTHPVERRGPMMGDLLDPWSRHGRLSASESQSKPEPQSIVRTIEACVVDACGPWTPTEYIGVRIIGRRSVSRVNRGHKTTFPAYIEPTGSAPSI